jgi:hypothetical protein
MRFYFSSVLLVISGVISASAQDGSVVMPALGFVFDAGAQAIRPIRGVPGASLLGDPLDAGSSLRAAFISPQQDLAIAIPADDAPLRIIRLGNVVIDVPAPGVMDSPDGVVFSPSGRTALLYRNSKRAQLMTGLPDHPAVTDLEASLETVGALAVSDDGALAVLGNWLLSADSLSRWPLPGNTSAASFRSGSHDLLAATADGSIYLMRHPEADADSHLVYAGDERTSAPAAIRFSPDGARAYTASEGGTLAAIELETGSIASISCGCRAAALEPLSARSLFRVTGISRLPLMLFDASRLEPRIWFVPALRSAGDSERSGQ